MDAAVTDPDLDSEPDSHPLPVDIGQDALIDLRKARRKNRLQELDWFEAAYRVYLVAILFGGTALWASSFIKDSKVAPKSITDIYHYGPAALGLLAVVALAAGLRSGARGGPIAIEDADVRHVLLSPVDRRKALLRPAFQRARSSASMGTLVGALAGQLAGHRLPGSDSSWVFAGAAFGLSLALLFVGAALVAHAFSFPRWGASGVGAVLLAWQTVSIVKHIAGPGNTYGSLALSGMRQRGIDVVAPIVSVALIVIGLSLLRRTSLDALARRSGLVAQLRFAVTMQDLRTVVLLRRQLGQENTRSRPWIRMRRTGGSSVVWRRGWHSLFRFPLSRVLRMTLLAVGAAACQVAAFKGTTALFLLSGGLLFLLGMEALEPLSQEIDQPDRMASLPHKRGDLLVQHLMVPSIALIPFAGVGVATVAVLDHRTGAVVVAAILALPTVWMGACGAAVSIVKDAPDLTSRSAEQTMLPPEMSGLTTILRTLLPLIVSVIGSTGVLVVRASYNHGQSTVQAAIRIGVAMLLLVAFTAQWVRKRDDWKSKFKGIMAEGKDVTAQQKAQRAQTRSSS
ncbi:MAG: hypothetical protein JWM34_1329 [Ilumatobacteraceae bacterium]|nr:hypothetical protein [Ilumatobacteraceae bacterium]